MLKRLILIAALLVMASSFAAAQGDGGQFCVRAFEDRNSNGTRDSGEPLLTRGISAELSNAQGIVIASQALEDSSNSASGVICFGELAAGTYMMSVISAEYRATTPSTSVETISPGTLPVILEYGGASMVTSANTTQGSSDALGLSSTDERTLIQRLVVSGLGSLAMIALMIVVGVFVWLTVVRPRALRRANRATTTGQFRSVSRDDMLSMYAPPATEDEFDAPR